MGFIEKIKKLLNRVYRLDTFVEILLSPIGKYLDKIYTILTLLRNNFFFDSLDESGCLYFEKLLAITPSPEDTIENRRARIQAKWLSNNHNCITLIQNICNSWTDGEAIANFVGGKISIEFTKTIGTPANLNSLLEAVKEIKPAHIPILVLFRYLIIEEIHEVMDIEELETIEIDKFEF